MVEIISKSSGPRREDVKIRKVLEANRSTITRLADQFSQGAYSASKVKREAPKAEGLIIHTGSAPAASEPRPYVRISANDRVVVMDLENGRQMHHLGDVHRRDGEDRFRLATRANGFFMPLNSSIAERLADLDGTPLASKEARTCLIEGISQRLGIDETAIR